MPAAVVAIQGKSLTNHRHHTFEVGVPAQTHPEVCEQGKARLGTVVHKKTATALALTNVKGEDQREFAKLVETARQSYNDGPRMSWGGGIMGPKSQARTRKVEKIRAKEAAQRLG